MKAIKDLEIYPELIFVILKGMIFNPYLVCSAGRLLVIWRPMVGRLDMRREL